jgi:polysaccharide deacetylase family protein (PEP-CTERM system associated)
MACRTRTRRGALIMRPDAQAERVVNALSIDVEDYFQVSALEPHFNRAVWDRTPCRVERNVDLILDMFAAAGARGTFFTLGWIAERYPAMVRRIADAGHEVASHGCSHQRVTELDRTAFTEDLLSSKQILEDLSGQSVRGYRAPSFSIGKQNLWAFDCLREAGYRYSSSVYPVRHDHYGMPDAPRFAYESRAGLLEVPITTLQVFNANVPVGGGGYFRLLPYTVSRWLIDRVNQTEHQAAVFYLHPWELDPEQPRVRGTRLKTRFRHYVNLHRTEPRLKRLLRDFAWDRMDRIFLRGVA